MIKMTLLPSPAVASPPLSETILLLFFFFMFFFSSTTLIIVSVAEAGDYCPPSSCGNLTNIRNPFRLKDDPSNCGDSNYELTCDHVMNRTILTLLSHTYYVTNITYHYGDNYYYDNYVDFDIQVNYVGMEKYNNKGSCRHLPLLIPSPLTYSNLKSNKYYETYGWVTLVNCSKEVKNMSIHDDEYYGHYYHRPVACLSHNNSFIYLIPSDNVGGLMPSCRFLAMLPNNIDWYLEKQELAEDILFKFLAQGFTLFRRLSSSRTIQNCLKSSIREAHQYITNNRNSILQRIRSILFATERHFLGCLDDYDYHDRKHYFRVMSIIYITVILLQIAKALIVLTVLGRCVFAPLTIYAFLSYKLHQMMSSIDIVEKFLRNQQTLVPTRYSYTDIVTMTSNFKEKLGQGGFGSVFKGRLPWDRLVAIKMLTNSKNCKTQDFCKTLLILRI